MQLSPGSDALLVGDLKPFLIPMNVIWDSFGTHVTLCAAKLYNVTWAFLFKFFHFGFHIYLSINGFSFFLNIILNL